MATKPGFLTDWPWKHLGSFKYVIMAPCLMQNIYSLTTKENHEYDYVNLLIIPFLLWRALHNQIWISISRHRTAKGNNRIIDRSIEFDQVDRESNWDDQILLNGILLYTFNNILDHGSFLPVWRVDGILITILLHAGPVEYLYYWLHRALHHRYLYSRYHSHHHSSIVTEPITSVIHPFAEHIAYFMLFAIPNLATVLTGRASLVSVFGYITYIDFMNNMGHCNFELVPKWVFSVFPPLKYLMYTPTFHSLHHTQFRTNYSLFMPLYDYVYGTMDKSSDTLYEESLRREEDSPDVIHLTHLTTPESIVHLQVGFASFASRPLNPQSSYSHLITWALSYWSIALSFVSGRAFIAERNVFEKLKLQSWAIPKFKTQYSLKWQQKAINGIIEEAIIEADGRGAKVLCLGLLNQNEELNQCGSLFVEKHPKLRIKIVNGNSLAIAVVLNSIPKDTTEVLFRGGPSKLALAVVSALCLRGIQVTVLYQDEKIKLSEIPNNQVVLTKSPTQKVWIVGDALTKDEQLKAPKGTLFIPFTQFPPAKVRKDAIYCHTPSMLAPPQLQNLNSCENWLPRRVMSAWRVAGVVHALEEWNVHECGDTIFDIEKMWKAALKHCFRPTTISQ